MLMILLSLRLALLPDLTPPTTTRRIDNDALPSLHGSGVFAPKVDIPQFFVIRLFSSAFAYLPHPDVLPALCVFAAVQAVRMVYSSLGEDGYLDWYPEFDISNNAVASGVLSFASRAGPQGEFSQ